MFCVTDIHLENGESEVKYEFIFENEDGEIIEEIGSYDVQSIVLSNQEKFTFDEEPSIELVTRILHECAEEYPSSRTVCPTDFGYDRYKVFYTNEYSIFDYADVVDFEVE